MKSKGGEESSSSSSSTADTTTTTPTGRRRPTISNNSKDFVYSFKGGKKSADTPDKEKKRKTTEPIGTSENGGEEGVEEDVEVDTNTPVKRTKQDRASTPMSSSKRRGGGAAANGNTANEESTTTTAAAADTTQSTNDSSAVTSSAHKPLKLTIRLGDKKSATLSSSPPATTENNNHTNNGNEKVKSPSSSSKKRKGGASATGEETTSSTTTTSTATTTTTPPTTTTTVTPGKLSVKIKPSQPPPPPYVSGFPSAPELKPDQLAFFKKTFTEILNLLIKKDEREIFYYPVTEDIAPNYFTHIKEPMAFETMKNNNKSGKYRSIEQFLYDFTLICENCMKYNQPESIYFKEAKRLLGVGKNLILSYTSKLHPERSAGDSSATTAADGTPHKPHLQGAVISTPSASTLREQSRRARGEPMTPTTPPTSSSRRASSTPVVREEPPAIAISAPKQVSVTRTKSKPGIQQSPVSAPVGSAPQTPGRPYPTTPSPAMIPPTRTGTTLAGYPTAAGTYPGTTIPNPLLQQATQQQLLQQQQQQQQFLQQHQQQQQQQQLISQASLLSLLGDQPYSVNISLPKRKYVKLGAVGEVNAKSQSIPNVIKPAFSLTKSIAEGNNIMITPFNQMGPHQYTMYVPRSSPEQGTFNLVDLNPVPKFLENVTNYQQRKYETAQRQYQDQMARFQHQQQLYIRQLQHQQQIMQQQQKQKQGEEKEKDKENEDEEDDEEEGEEEGGDQKMTEEVEEKDKQQDQNETTEQTQQQQQQQPMQIEPIIPITSVVSPPHLQPPPPPLPMESHKISDEKREKLLEEAANLEKPIKLNGLSNYLYIKFKSNRQHQQLLLQQQLQRNKLIEQTKYLKQFIRATPKDSLDYLNKQMNNLIHKGKLEEDGLLKNYIENHNTLEVLDLVKQGADDILSSDHQPTIEDIEKIKASTQHLFKNLNLDPTILQSIEIKQPQSPPPPPTPSSSTINNITSPILTSDQKESSTTSTTDAENIPVTTTPSTTSKKMAQQLLDESFEELCKLQLSQYSRNIPTPTPIELQLASNLHNNIGKLGVQLPPSAYIKSRESIRLAIVKSGLSVGSNRQPRANFKQLKKDALSSISSPNSTLPTTITSPTPTTTNPTTTNTSTSPNTTTTTTTNTATSPSTTTTTTTTATVEQNV